MHYIKNPPEKGYMRLTALLMTCGFTKLGKINHGSKIIEKK